ncbi:hypothetical protein CMQ_6973 [Grosmannia clavigera kw1407]|uniref:Uncharacterized protein n=1 Tax=Grosmannia clavigera (strain kw1407 / UAMH 11150) TaxID=655863 RepID=F0X795_GROCL|nr:uncharacterized protein CMQ_6973 [Grosmannia clavigera kw1407]EFX06652.1 hypothetical protein CMQ_6973 [Grosmannia clavigera kw1407]
MKATPRRARFSTGLGSTVDSLFTEYSAANPISDTPFVAPETAAERDRVWSAWTDTVLNTVLRFCRYRSDVDPLQYWVDFVGDPASPVLQTPAQVFLHVYVTESH